MPGPPDSPEREANDLLTSAEQDLGSAEALAGDDQRPPRHACLLAHLAGEKALKAALIARGIDYRFTHDLDELRLELPSSDQELLTTDELGPLAGWSIKGRYGALADEPSRGVAHDTVAAAHYVIGIVANIIADAFPVPGIGPDAPDPTQEVEFPGEGGFGK